MNNSKLYFKLSLVLNLLLILILGAKASGLISSVSSGGQLASTTMNEIINRVIGISYNSGTKLMELEGGIKYNKLSTNTCDNTSKGAIIFSGTSFLGCNGSDWKSFTGNSTKTIIISSSGRMWSDGTIARSCNGYLNPSAGYSYAGSVGNGIYWIQPVGLSAMKVYCDMTNEGGGRMLAYAALNQKNGSNPYNTSYRPSDSGYTDLTKQTGFKWIIDNYSVINYTKLIVTANNSLTPVFNVNKTSNYGRSSLVKGSGGVDSIFGGNATVTDGMGITWNNNSWTSYEAGWNGGYSGGCGGHVRRYDYPSNGTHYISKSNSTDCVGYVASGNYRVVSFWVK